MAETAKIGDREVTLRPINLRQLRDNWKVLSEKPDGFEQRLTVAATFVGLSCGWSPDEVLEAFGANGAEPLFELSIRVGALSGLEAPKPTGEPASP